VGLQFPAARRRAGRERLLATAGLTLLAAPDADAVRRVAAAATAELVRRASVDPLTGLHNRAAFATRLRETLAALAPEGPPRLCSCSTWTTSRHQ
jgi:GGDEF domain-containing protein